MCDYIDSKDVSSDKSRIDKIIKVINDWSNRVPHHLYKNYGNQIVIEKVDLLPIYEFELTTQYDKRSLEVKTVPYDGESISEQLYSYPDEVDIWNYECEEPEEFIESMGDYHVHGSDSVSSCYNCQGHGKLRCPRCDGKKIITCPTCGGNSTKTCPTCNGRRYQMRSCNHCSDGTYLNTSTGQRQRCSHCNGNGQKKERCSTCDGAGVKHCSKCRGAGKIDCPTCSKKGYIRCAKCDGTGNLKTYYEIHQQLRFQRAINTHKHQDIEEYFSAFDIDREIEVPLIMDIRDRYYKIDEFDMPDSIKETLSKLLENAESDLNEHEVLHQQQIRVWRYDTYIIEYEWDGNQNSMLVDESAQIIYDPFGPIYSKINDLYDDAHDLMGQKKYSAAIKKNSKALEMDLGGYLSHLTEMQDELSGKVMGSYMKGVWVANILFGIIGYYFSMKYFVEPHFYLEIFEELFYRYEQFPIVFAHHMGIIFLVATFLVTPDILKENLKDRFGYYLTNSAIRFFIGFAGMTWSSIYQLVVLIIVNISGLTLVTGFISFGFYRLIAWILQLF